jgi:hypothetical protein
MNERRGGGTAGSSAAPRSERRRELVAVIAEQQLSDTRFDRLRTRARRRQLVAAMLASIGATSASFWLGWPIVAAAALLAGIAVWGLLRAAVRTLADLPDDVLDERQLQVRDRAYLHAYRAFAGLAMVAVIAALTIPIVIGGDPDRLIVEFDLGRLQAVFWLVTGLAMSLPSIVIALAEPEI